MWSGARRRPKIAKTGRIPFPGAIWIMPINALGIDAQREVNANPGLGIALETILRRNLFLIA